MIQQLYYSTDGFPLKRLFSDLLNFWDLENIHMMGGFEEQEAVPGKDNISAWHKKFYGLINGPEGRSFMACYRQFIKIVIQPKLFHGKEMVYQRYPTLRCHIPGKTSVATYHVDTEYNHFEEELNLWLPLTAAIDTNTIWIESAPGKKDYRPINGDYGSLTLFPGGKLSHGNKSNTYDWSRVSIDMRVMPMELWVHPVVEKKSISFGRVMDIEGENAYFDVMK